MRVSQVVLLLLVAGCAARDGERRSLRTATGTDSSRSSAEASLGADAPPQAVTSSVIGGDASAQQDVLEYLGRHLYQSWNPDSALDSGSDEICRLDKDLEDGIELNAAHGIVRAHLLSLTRSDSLPKMDAQFEALRVVSIQDDTAQAAKASGGDMIVVGAATDTISMDFYRRADGRWVACGPPIRQTTHGQFIDPIAFTGPPGDTLNVRGVPSRHFVPAKSSWSRVRALADSLGGPSSAAVIQKRVWAGAYAAPADVDELPEAVRNNLTQMRCLIPLTFSGDGRAPMIVRGALYARGRPDDWAVACSRTSAGVRASTLYVFGSARGFAADSVEVLGPDVVRDDHRDDGTTVTAHKALINLDENRSGALADIVTAAGRESLELTDSELRQPLHDGLDVNLDPYFRAYWTGARWIRIYLPD